MWKILLSWIQLIFLKQHNHNKHLWSDTLVCCFNMIFLLVHLRFCQHLNDTKSWDKFRAYKNAQLNMWQKYSWAIPCLMVWFKLLQSGLGTIMLLLYCTIHKYQYNILQYTPTPIQFIAIFSTTSTMYW